MFQSFAQKRRNYPIVSTAGYQAREFDWLGRKRRRVFGLPYDAVAPFAPIITSDTPLDQWMNKHAWVVSHGLKPGLVAARCTPA